MLESLEVGDGELITGEEALAMLCEALLVDGADGTIGVFDPIWDL